MYDLKDFSCWMKDNTQLSDISISKYVGGVKAVSADMINEGIINKELMEMCFGEIDASMPCILNNPFFIAKNKRGNNMYSCALKQLRCYISEKNQTEDELSADITAIRNNVNLTVTEKETLVAARRGQGRFRKELIEKYSGKCVITGISLPGILIASHIKPWAVSNNADRLSRENGLLLSASYDGLFDKGYISFKDNGTILISGNISKEDRKCLGLNDKSQYNIIASAEMRQNLEYHRDVVFIK